MVNQKNNSKFTKKNLIFIPSGIAHGFHVKSKNALVGYLLNKPYKKSLDTGVKYDSFNFSMEYKKKNNFPKRY